MKGEKVPRIIPPGGCRAGEFSKTLVSCTTKGRKRRGRRRGGYGRHDLQHVNFFFSLLFAEGLAINYTSSAIRRFGIRKGRKRKTNDAGKETRGREDDRGPHEPDLLSGNAAPDD